MNEDRGTRWALVLWLQWVFAYSISIAIGYKIATSLSHINGKSFIGDYLYPIIGGVIGWLIFAFLVAIAQWIVLTRYGDFDEWILWTVIGVLFLNYMDGSLLLVSIPQSIILWGQTRWAGLWVIAHIPAFLFFMAFSSIWIGNISIYTVLTPDNWLLVNDHYVPLISGVIGAIFSGFALVWLLRHPKEA